MKKKNNKFILVKTKRNKGLEPLPTEVGVIGYDEEIHAEDSQVFTYELPLGAVKRLIKSYYEDIRMYDEENVYGATFSSSGIRAKPYCYRMLNEIRNQLNGHGFKGQEIDDKVFDQYFKKNYEEMKRFNKNHGSNVRETFKPCSDPECCKNGQNVQ